MDTYLGFAVVFGLWSWSRGWSFWSGFVVSLLATPVVGLVFILIRGKRDKDYPGLF